MVLCKKLIISFRISLKHFSVQRDLIKSMCLQENVSGNLGLDENMLMEHSKNQQDPEGEVKVKVTQSCPILCNLMDYTVPPNSSVPRCWVVLSGFFQMPR